MLTARALSIRNAMRKSNTSRAETVSATSATALRLLVRHFLETSLSPFTFVEATRDESGEDVDMIRAPHDDAGQAGELVKLRLKVLQDSVVLYQLIRPIIGGHCP